MLQGDYNRKRGRQSTVLKSAYKRESVPHETEFDAFDFGGDGGNEIAVSSTAKL